MSPRTDEQTLKSEQSTFLKISYQCALSLYLNKGLYIDGYETNIQRKCLVMCEAWHGVVRCTSDYLVLFLGQNSFVLKKLFCIENQEIINFSSSLTSPFFYASMYLTSWKVIEYFLLLLLTMSTANNFFIRYAQRLLQHKTFQLSTLIKSKLKQNHLIYERNSCCIINSRKKNMPFPMSHEKFYFFLRINFLFV